MMQALLLAALFLFQGVSAPTGIISGRIRSSNGLAAAGIRVSAMLAPEAGRQDAADAGALFSQTQTDEDGRYRLEGIPPGRYYIMAGRVDAPTYYPGKEDVLAATALSVVSGTPIEGIDFTMTDASAQIPINLGNGPIFIAPASDVTIPVRIRLEGAARLPLMSVQGRTQVSAKPTANNGPASGPMVVQVSPAASVGVVISNSGLGGFTLVSPNLLRTTPGIFQADGNAAVKVSPGEHRFSVDNLPPEYEVKSMTVGAVDLLQSPYRVIGGSTQEIQLTLGLKNPSPGRQGRTVSGKILDGPSGKPWVAEAVYLSSKPGTLFADGTFEFPGIAPGRYALEAREGLPGDRKAQKDIVVGNADLTADLTYTTVPLYVRVAGRVVVDAGNPPRLNNVRVTIRNTGTPLQVAGDGKFSTAMTEGAYQISLSDLPVGYMVKSITSGSVDLLKEPFQIQPALGPVAPDVIVTLGTSPRYKVQGRVIAVPPTRPVEGAEVVLSGGPESYRTTAAKDGTFEFPLVLPASYTLAIRPFGFTYVNATVVVADQDLLRLEFKSEPAY